MIKISKAIATLMVWLLFTYNSFSQAYFSKRLDVANLLNESGAFKLYNDTFFIPAFVIETNGLYSVSLLKVDITGAIVTQKRFHPPNINYTGGEDLYIRNNKFYVPSVTDYGSQLQAGFYVFDKNCDTVFTKSYGDTTYYNYGNKILPYKKTADKLLIFGETDSTCGTGHPGFYKPIIRIVDTNGVLYQTKMYLNATCKYRNILSVDTTKNKGYIVCGSENFTFFGTNFLIKLDSNLNQVWLNYYDSTANGGAGIVTLKSGMHVLAHTQIDSTYNTFFWDKVALTKIDENGNIIWKKLYGLNDQAVGATSIKELPNKDFIICGQRQVLYSSTAGQQVGFLMRTDSSGNLKWWHNYYPTSPVKDTAGQCYLYEVLLMPDGGFAAVGWAGSSGIVNKAQTWLLRVDSMGCLSPGCNSSTDVNYLQAKTDLEVSVYPNPTNGLLTVNYSIQDPSCHSATLQLVEVATGRVIIKKSISCNSNQTEIDLKEFPNGVYSLNIHSNQSILKNIRVIKIQ